jgi:hypothetical protein
MPGSSAGITSGLLLMLQKAQAGDWESASYILRLIERHDLPNHRELRRVAAVRAKLPSLRTALHIQDKGSATEAIRAAIEAWEKPTQDAKSPRVVCKDGQLLVTND